MKEEFYIGYLEKMPAGLARFIRKVIVLLFVVVIVVALIVSFYQRGFLPSTYEYYRDTELTGTIISQPVPALQVNWGYDLQQNPIIKTIPIVAFGKIGGGTLIRDFINTRVTVTGKLIYYDGKALLELSGPDPVKSASPQAAIDLPKPDYHAPVDLRGEIVDAKCFFGVMKPGHGKPHRSCAIRCISGGIPAVFRSQGKDGVPVYYLIDEQSKSNIAWDRYVGESVEITGTAGDFNDWKVLLLENIEPVVAAGEVLTIESAGIALCY